MTDRAKRINQLLRKFYELDNLMKSEKFTMIELEGIEGMLQSMLGSTQRTIQKAKVGRGDG